MADAISFDESFWVEEIDPTDPESLSSVSVDYTPAFNMGVCFKENFEVYLKYLSLLDPLESDLLILYHYCDKKVKEIAKILKSTPVKVSGLINQAEQRLAILLHINLLVTNSVLQEINMQVPSEYERNIFRTFLREVSRRRTAHVLAISFHQVSTTIKKIVDTLAKSPDLSIELAELLKIISPTVTAPRETRQLEPSERVCIFDVLICPQQVYAESTQEAPKLTLGSFGETCHELTKEYRKAANQAAYFSVSQSLLAHQLETSSVDAWDYLVPSFINRLISTDQFVSVFTQVEPLVEPLRVCIPKMAMASRKQTIQKLKVASKLPHLREASAVM